jgi:glutamate---cysteine ligase / carboxylate-amine ligase
VKSPQKPAKKPNRLFTLGIEEEFQIIDPVTRELRSHIEEILEDGKMLLRERVKPEMHQSVVEVGTDICATVADARRAVTTLRSDLWRLARNRKLTIAAAGTHPFSHWRDQKITEGERYKGIVDDMQEIARANLIFGLHVHVGIPDRHVAIQVMNMARYFLPHLFALSTNSPFWVGRNTGFKSYRIKVFERFPRTGIPDAFESLSEYNDYLDLLVKTKCIDNAKKIWWDIRLHPFFDTIEFRVCDIPMRVEETIALAGLMQALVSYLHKLLKKNLTWRNYRRRLLDENRWRASRYGLDGKLIDFGKQEEVPARELIGELLELVDGELDEFGSRKEVGYIHDILKNGTGADRQLAVWQKTRDLRAVVDYIVSETTAGLKK